MSTKFETALSSNCAGIPLYIGDVYAGNRNDLFDIIPQFQRLVAWCKAAGIKLKGVRLNMDKKFDYKKLQRFCFRHGIIPNVKENPRNRKNRGPDQSDYLTKNRIKIASFASVPGPGLILFIRC